MKDAWKTIILVIVPLAMGFLVNRLIIIGFSSGYVGLFNVVELLYTPLVQTAFLIFWTWVGYRFAMLNIKKVTSFLLGNSLNILGFVTYIVLFYAMGDAMRLTIRFVGYAQLAIVPVLVLGSRITILFSSGTIDGRVPALISYLLLFLAFSIGFLYRNHREKSGA